MPPATCNNSASKLIDPPFASYAAVGLPTTGSLTDLEVSVAWAGTSLSKLMALIDVPLILATIPTRLDEWKSDGCFHYVGEGQRKTGGNRAILEASQN
jgi:hypothetical protein